MDTCYKPSPDNPATLANWRTAPYNQWSFHHVGEIVPSATIKHSPANIKDIAAGVELELPEITFANKTYNQDEFLSATHTDALVVLHNGKLIHETYRSGMSASDPHILMSISKSMLALLVAVLAEKNVLDVSKDVVHYLPEISTTGFAGATLQQLLDMRCGVVFDEDYLATEGPIIDYRKATNWNPLTAGEEPADLRSFLLSLNDKPAPHGGVVDYKSVCSDLLGWVVERVCRQRYADVFSEHIWSILGAEYPAQITVDRLGAPRVAGGMSMTTRDLARVGQMLVDDGGSIIPAAWINDVEQNGDASAWQQGTFRDYYTDLSMHYRSKWYCMRGENPVLHCLGIHGQHLFVDRKAGLIMAKHASAPEPLNPFNELISFALFKAIGRVVL